MGSIVFELFHKSGEGQTWDSLKKKGEPQAVDFTALEIEHLLGIFVGILTGKAWQYMGLRLAPGKEEVEKDMAKASLAIDCTAYLSEKLEPMLPEAEAERLKAMIADLQLNYAKQV